MAGRSDKASKTVKPAKNLSHLQSLRQDWNTPPWILDLIRQHIGCPECNNTGKIGPAQIIDCGICHGTGKGRIHLDPCWNPHAFTDPIIGWDYVNRGEDGYHQSWDYPTVFCNPPYGDELPRWAEKAREEGQNNFDTMLYYLVPARTETNWFKQSIRFADLIAFLPRFAFYLEGKVGTPATGGMLLAWWAGDRLSLKRDDFLAIFRKAGWVLDPLTVHWPLRDGAWLRTLIKREIEQTRARLELDAEALED